MPSSYLIQKVVNKERTLALAAICVLIGSIIAALAPSYNVLLVGRMIAGAGSAINIIAAMVLLNNAATSENRGSVLAIFQAFFLGGFALGPGLGGVAASLYGWQGAFWVASVAAILALILCWLLFVLTIHEQEVAIECHTKEVKDVSKNDMDNSLGQDYSFWVNVAAVHVATFILLFALEGFNSTIIPLYGAMVLKLDPGVIGVILGSVAITRFLMSLFGGVLSDKLGRGAILVPTLIIAGIGTICLQFASTLASYFLVVTFFGIGRMGNNVNVAMLGDVVPPEKMGLMIGINRFVADLGFVMGPWVLSWIVDNRGFAAAGMAVGIISWLSALMIWRVFGLSFPLEKRPGQQF